MSEELSNGYALLAHRYGDADKVPMSALRGYLHGRFDL